VLLLATPLWPISTAGAQLALAFGIRFDQIKIKFSELR
jgi:hypothetical protein